MDSAASGIPPHSFRSHSESRRNRSDPEAAMTVNTPTRAGRGQVLIITAFAMAVVLGIAALVVDLGMSWMLRRQEQNAADPAAIAAARWLKDPATGLATMNLPEMNSDA